MTNVSFPRALRRLVEQDGDAVAVTCADRAMTRRELDLRSNRTARAYERLGVRHGDLVTICLPNDLDWFVACLAVWKLGAVPNPVSPSLPAPERAAIIERAQPALTVGVDEPAGGRPTLPAGFVPDGTLPDTQLPDRISPMERVLASGGSTGLPKLICARTPATHDTDSPLAVFTASTCLLVTGPLYHGIPYAAAWRTLLSGATVVVMPRFDAEQALALVQRHRVDQVNLVPTMMHRITRLPGDVRAAYDVSSLRTVIAGGAPCPAWLMREWIDWLGPEVMHEAFGSTERLGGTFITGKEWLAHPGSVGRPVGGSRLRIVDPGTGEECPPGVMGEIYLMPPGGPGSTYAYVGAEPQVDDAGWESIGDMGYLDEDGYLYLGDRRDDMILSRGRNIYPAEIEAVLDAHPRVRSSAVIGLPDDDLGQRVHAVVQADRVTVAELAAHVRERLVHYKVPRTYEVVSRPLRDDSGKVRRSALREERLLRTSEEGAG